MVHNLVGMYADDIKIFSKITANPDKEKLQFDLANLDERSRVWQLKFNVSKCNIMYFGKKNPCFEYTMGENDKQVQVQN